MLTAHEVVHLGLALALAHSQFLTLSYIQRQDLPLEAMAAVHAHCHTPKHLEYERPLVVFTAHLCGGVHCSHTHLGGSSAAEMSDCDIVVPPRLHHLVIKVSGVCSVPAHDMVGVARNEGYGACQVALPGRESDWGR